MIGKTLETIDKNGTGLVRIYQGDEVPSLPTDITVLATCMFATVECGKWVLVSDGEEIIGAEV